MNPPISIARFFGRSLTKTLAVIAITVGSHASVVKAQPVIAVGPDAQHVPVVKRITVNAISGNDILSFAAYRRTFTGGVRVAVGDVTPPLGPRAAQSAHEGILCRGDVKEP